MADVPGIQEEVIQSQEVVVAAETAHAAVIRAAAASAQEVTVAWERAMTFLKEVEAWAILAEREAQERVLRVEAERDTLVASACGLNDELAQKVALL
jgi:hypothetical protein